MTPGTTPGCLPWQGSHPSGQEPGSSSSRCLEEGTQPQFGNNLCSYHDFLRDEEQPAPPINTAQGMHPRGNLLNPGESVLVAD